MSQDKLDELSKPQRKLSSMERGEHIGIKNVYLRLNMFFNNNVTMDFYNNSMGGASVLIKIPLTAVTEVGKNV